MQLKLPGKYIKDLGRISSSSLPPYKNVNWSSSKLWFMYNIMLHVYCMRERQNGVGVCAKHNKAVPSIIILHWHIEDYGLFYKVEEYNSLRKVLAFLVGFLVTQKIWGITIDKIVSYQWWTISWRKWDRSNCGLPVTPFYSLIYIQQSKTRYTVHLQVHMLTR